VQPEKKDTTLKMVIRWRTRSLRALLDDFPVRPGFALQVFSYEFVLTRLHLPSLDHEGVRDADSSHAVADRGQLGADEIEVLSNVKLRKRSCTFFSLDPFQCSSTWPF